jgi:arginine repressor
VAYEIDEQKSVFFLGTVAGDDTVMIILAEDVNREQATTFLMDAVPQLRKRQQNANKKEK